MDFLWTADECKMNSSVNFGNEEDENMQKVVSIGKQSFEQLREKNYFYIDKTKFIEAWWQSGDDLTLITRPRRFGKTLNMDMLKCFFSNQYKERADLFEGLYIWRNEAFRELQGAFPVIFLSFAAVKADNFEDAKKQMNAQIVNVYEAHRYLVNGTLLSENEKNMFNNVTIYMSDAEASIALNTICKYLYRYYGRKTIILLDEYDTPMQEAYIQGYWPQLTSFIRSFFNATFKSNDAMERAVLTGITRISKESVFSDLNNLNVVTTTSEEYEDCFGFTESEVFQALEVFGLSEEKENVRQWYDGFTFGRLHDIYNPWSITNFLDKRKFSPYWATTSSNALISQLIRIASPDIKYKMERLMQNEEIIVSFDEQIVFDQLDKNEDAIWSLMVASGYLKVANVEYKGLLRVPWYHLQITNLETLSMFSGMFSGWFERSKSVYNGFIRALLKDNKKEMNVYMNEVALTTFSSFDSGKHPSNRMQPEKFYHGFVLGLLVELREEYEVKSNNESGLGRYDVMLIPKNKKEHSIIMEFKVHDPDEEQSLEDTVKSALKQIEDKKYDTELFMRGIEKECIYHYGFAFEGKHVLIG